MENAIHKKVDHSSMSYLEQAFPYMKTQNPKRLNLAKTIHKPITDEIQYNVYLFKCQFQSNKCVKHVLY